MHEEKDVCFMIKHVESMMMRNTCGKMFKGIERPAMMEGWIIDYLYNHTGKIVYQKDLEMQSHLPKSTIATILKKMERKNMLLRIPDEEDTRLKRIELSREGYELHDKVKTLMLNMNEVMCQGVTEEELSIFMSVSQKFIHNLEKNMKGSECEI